MERVVWLFPYEGYEVLLTTLCCNVFDKSYMHAIHTPQPTPNHLPLIPYTPLRTLTH